MKENLIFIAIAAAIIGLPTAYVWAHVSACGWRGLFVECRVMECRK